MALCFLREETTKFDHGHWIALLGAPQNTICHNLICLDKAMVVPFSPNHVDFWSKVHTTLIDPANQSDKVVPCVVH